MTINNKSICLITSLTSDFPFNRSLSREEYFLIFRLIDDFIGIHGDIYWRIKSCILKVKGWGTKCKILYLKLSRPKEGKVLYFRSQNIKHLISSFIFITFPYIYMKLNIDAESLSKKTSVERRHAILWGTFGKYNNL